MDLFCDIYCCDNLELMEGLKSESLDFIYLDPPFFSGADYYTRDKRKAYGDKWRGNVDEYLNMLGPRLQQCRRLLKGSGLIALHLDWHGVHYAKVLMDQLYGIKNFVNELIWVYKSGGSSGRHFSRKHDNILLYSRSGDYYFKAQKEKSYNRGGKPYRFKDVQEFCDEDGRWYTMVNRKDVLSIDMVGRSSKERTGYATQKPEALMEALIESCCPPGGICADFFAGSGSLGAAALKGGRSCLLCDSNPTAFELMKERLKDFLP